MALCDQLLFHVYDRNTKNEVVTHSLTVEQLEDKLREGTVQLNNHEIEVVSVNHEDSIDASF